MVNETESYKIAWLYFFFSRYYTRIWYESYDYLTYFVEKKKEQLVIETLIDYEWFLLFRSLLSQNFSLSRKRQHVYLYLFYHEDTFLCIKYLFSNQSHIDVQKSETYKDFLKILFLNYTFPWHTKISYVIRLCSPFEEIIPLLDCFFLNFHSVYDLISEIFFISHTYREMNTWLIEN